MEGKPIYKSKTFWFNLLAFIAAIAGAFGYSGQVPEEWKVFIPAIVALINIVLRTVTKEPVRLK